VLLLEQLVHPDPIALVEREAGALILARPEPVQLARLGGDAGRGGLQPLGAVSRWLSTDCIRGGVMEDVGRSGACCLIQ